MSSGDTASGSRGALETTPGRPASFTSVLHPTGAELLSAIAAGHLPQQPARQNGGGSGGSQHPGVDSGVSKRTKEQEKNRRAQARFRERQKVHRIPTPCEGWPVGDDIIHVPCVSHCLP